VTLPAGSAPVFPVGYAMGPLHVPGAPGPAPSVVRLGRDDVALHGAEATVWALAHGGAPNAAALDAATLVRSAEQLRVPEAGQVVARLVERGLLVAVPAADPVSVARRYRLRSLLVGLGSLPGFPGERALGLPAQPRLRLSAAAAQRWTWWPVLPTLLDAATAQVTLDTSDAQPTDLAVTAELRHFFGGVLPALLGQHCAFLDRAH